MKMVLKLIDPLLVGLAFAELGFLFAGLNTDVALLGALMSVCILIKWIFGKAPAT